MKFLIQIAICMLPFLLAAQTDPGDKILGTWLVSSGKAKIEITRYGNKYGGKIVWIREPNDETGHPKKDSKNPDPSKRNNPRLGLNLLLGFVYTEKNKYEEGT